jgi:DNA-binding CsgD family transcriptional regulator
MENKIKFSKREKDVIALAKKGYSYKEMAAHHTCTVFAINHIVKALYKKLEVRSMTKMLAKVKRMQDDRPIEDIAKEEWIKAKMWGGEVEYNYFLKGFELASNIFK